MKTILIGTPCVNEQVSTAYLHTISSLIKNASSSKIPYKLSIDTFSSADVAFARTYFANKVLYDDGEFDYLLFIDSDIGFDSSMLSDMLEFDKPIVAGLCPKRVLNISEFHSMSKKLEFEDDAQIASLDFICENQLIEGTQCEDASFYQVKAVGTGIMLIKREVFGILKQNYPTLLAPRSLLKEYSIFEHTFQCFSAYIDEGVYLSEDLSFCKRWTLIGGELWACISKDITHLGTHAFTGNYQEKMDMSSLW